MKEYAKVVGIEEGEAVLEVRRHASCDDCGGCLETGDRRELKVRARNPIGAKPGQMVKVEIADKKMMGAVFMVYLVPLLGFFIGYFVGSSLSTSLAWGDAELVGAGVGIIFLMASFLLAREYGKRGKEEGKHQPVIKRVVDITFADIEKANKKGGFKNE